MRTVFIVFLWVFFSFCFAANDDPFHASRREVPLVAEFIPLQYADAKTVASNLQDKRIRFDARTNQLWIQADRAFIEKIKSYVAHVDIPTPQVLIQARIVNADTTNEDEIGARLGVSHPSQLSGTLSGANSLAQGTAVASVPLAERLNFDMPATQLFDHPGRLGLAVAQLGHGVFVDMELSAMEREQVLRVVASPRLIASNKQVALIESGEEIPYEQSTKEGATNAVFKKAVLRLHVIPQIVKNNRVILTLSVNQDKPGEITQQGVSIKTQHMQTQVIVQDKQTIVVGGIYETTSQHEVSRIPGLSSLPLLGHLFTHQLTKQSRQELLIFITPEIIHGT